MRKIDSYFHPRAFVGNNIDFRIGSAAALARFKDSQTYILSQLAFNPFHKYSETAKEILLLKYDLCFDCMCEIEQYLLIHMHTYIDPKEIIRLTEMRVQYHYDTLKGQPDIVNPAYLECWHKQHTELMSHIGDTIEDTIAAGLLPASIFSALVEMMIKVVNHTMFELQELDIIYFTDETPVFNIDELSCIIQENKEHCPLYERIVKMREIRPFNSIIIKDYLTGSNLKFDIKSFYEKLDALGITYTIV